MSKRRSLGIMAVAVAVLIAAGVTTIKLTHTTDSKPAVQKADNRPISDTEIQVSANRATNYLQANLAQVAPYQRLVLDFLQRKFQIGTVFSGQITPIHGPTEGTEATEYAALERIAYPDHLVDSLPPPDTTTNSMIAYAANCDRIPLPDGYENTLRQNLKEGSYGTTHVVFAFDFIYDNGCPVPASWAKIRQQALQGTLRFAINPAVDQDIRYESIAFVLHNGMRASVKPAAIRQIIKEQRHDGGWGGAATDTGMQDHQTVLALWALLEYAHPDAPKVSLIQHPN